MTLDEMLSDVTVLKSTCPRSLALAGVTHDSRAVRPGYAFVAVRGLKHDGLAFAPQALASGAAAIVVGPGRSEEARRLLDARSGAAAGVIEVADERLALALMSHNAERRPDLEMTVTGITGTK